MRIVKAKGEKLDLKCFGAASRLSFNLLEQQKYDLGNNSNETNIDEKVFLGPSLNKYEPRRIEDDLRRKCIHIS